MNISACCAMITTFKRLFESANAAAIEEMYKSVFNSIIRLTFLLNVYITIIL